MKIFLLSLCLVVTVVAAGLPRSFNRNRNDFSKNDEELLKLAGTRRFIRNDTIPMRSAKFPKPFNQEKISIRHGDTHLEHFSTRLDHFSATDTRMVEFVSFKSFFFNR